jgi:hypothetical protein
VREDPLRPVNLAFDAAGDLLVVSYEGDGTVYSFRPDSSEQEITYLRPVPGSRSKTVRLFCPRMYGADESS